jgi:hypothetical protein
VLLAGKPILQIPLVLKHRLAAEATARMGVAEVLSPRSMDGEAVRTKLEAPLDEPQCAEATRGFARNTRRPNRSVRWRGWSSGWRS